MPLYPDYSYKCINDGFYIVDGRREEATAAG